MNELIKNTINWARDKGILNPDNKYKQFLKMTEELGEYLEAETTLDKPQMELEAGDVFVTIIILMSQSGVSPFEIFQNATTTARRSLEMGPANVTDSYLLRCFAALAGSLFKNQDPIYDFHLFLMTFFIRCHHHDIDKEYALMDAYKKIKDRKTVTVDGKVIKQADLTDT